MELEICPARDPPARFCQWPPCAASAVIRLIAIAGQKRSSARGASAPEPTFDRERWAPPLSASSSRTTRRPESEVSTTSARHSRVKSSTTTSTRKRRSATKVVVFQSPWGTPERSRSPLGDWPRRRTMLVEAQVSSMKIRRAGSSSGWPSNHSSRLLATSGRSCSLACAVFFECQAAAVEEGPDRADAGARAALGCQPLADLCDGDVVLPRDPGEDRLAMGVELRPPRLPARPGCAEPVSRARRTQTMAVAMPTPNRAAAERAESVSFTTASITRSRRS